MTRSGTETRERCHCPAGAVTMRPRRRTVRGNTPAISNATARIPKPDLKEWVRPTKNPTKDGPRKPPSPAETQLMVPVAIAAAESQRKAEGMAQKLGRKASRLAVAIENRNKEGRNPQSVTLSTSNAAAVTQSGIVVCQRRSELRSECQPFTCMATKPSTLGKATSRVTLKSLSPDKRFSMVGNQKAKAYADPFCAK